ncbi:MAG: hypothetical protein ACFCGT_18290 [Sandaracinaceae bacterium]
MERRSHGARRAPTVDGKTRYLRLSYATEEASLAEGRRRIAAAEVLLLGGVEAPR